MFGARADRGTLKFLGWLPGHAKVPEWGGRACPKEKQVWKTISYPQTEVTGNREKRKQDALFSRRKDFKTKGHTRSRNGVYGV